MYPYAYRLRYLQKLHQDAFMGLNAVVLGDGLPPGAVYRSSLPATPVSTPIRENWVFSEQALRERLCKTPSPRKCRLFDPRRRSEAGLHDEEGWAAEGDCSDSLADDDLDSPNEDADSVRENDDYVQPKRKIFVGNIPSKVSVSELKGVFCTFGKITNVAMYCVEPDKKRWPRPFALVTFAKKEDAERALAAGREGDPRLRIRAARMLRLLPSNDPRALRLRQLATREHHGLSDEIDGVDESLITEDASLCDDEDESTGSGAKSISSLNQLPDEVIAAIVERLDWRTRVQMERVCKRWQCLARKSWTNQNDLSHVLGSFTETRPLSIEVLRTLLTRCRGSLKRIDVSTTAGIHHTISGSEAAEAISQLCPNIEHLTLSGLRLTNVILQQVAQKCPKLRRVELARCGDIGEKGLWWLFHLCKHVEHMDLTGLSKVTGQCFHMSGQRLRSVVLDECTGVTHAGFVKLALKCSFLQSISLNSVVQLTDKDLNFICSNLRAIKAIRLSGGGLRQLTAAGLCSLNKLQQLEEVDLSANTEVTDDVICAIARACIRLRNLDISRCCRVTDLAFSAISQCSNLVYLDSSYLDKLTDTGLRSLVSPGQHIALQKLACRGCPSITEEGVSLIIRHCPSLTLLDVSGCTALTNSLVDQAVPGIDTRSSCLPGDSPVLTTAAKPSLELVIGSTGITYKQSPSSRIRLTVTTTCVTDFVPKSCILGAASSGDRAAECNGNSNS